MTAYRPVLEIALAYGMEYPQNYMKAVTLNLNGGSIGGTTGDISIVVKNIEVLDPSYPAVTFLAPTKEGLTRRQHRHLFHVARRQRRTLRSRRRGSERGELAYGALGRARPLRLRWGRGL